MKGKQQKAKGGGTPGRAPIGYRNAGIINEEGREVRTVLIDHGRAPLIKWASNAYAGGEWTIRELASELAERGLMSAPTPARPGKLINATQLHKILMNPYYKGDVRFQGATFPGRHEPTVDAATWQRVQDVMAAHVVGEKVREHHHYLKSTVYCGACESRLIVHHPKNRHGTVYDYFVCSGRHEKRTKCQQQAVDISLIESKIVELYRGIQLSATVREGIERVLRVELELSFEESRQLQHELTLERARLQARGKKLLDGHLDGIVPAELYGAEQEAISRQLASIDERLASMNIEFATLETTLSQAMELAEHCYEAYRRAPDALRRRFNQAFFTHIYVDEDGSVTGRLSEPFDSVLLWEAEAFPPARRTSGDKIALDQLEQIGGSNVISLAQGSRQNSLVPLEGLEPPTLSLGRNCSSIELQRLGGSSLAGVRPEASGQECGSARDEAVEDGLGVLHFSRER